MYIQRFIFIWFSIGFATVQNSASNTMDIDAQYSEIVECGQRLVKDCEAAAAAASAATPFPGHHDAHQQQQRHDSMYNSLLDNEAVTSSEASSNGVIINVSTLYIACDEQKGVDQVANNLRVIDLKILLELVTMVRQVLDNSVDQCEFSTLLMNRLVSMHSRDINNLLDFMNKITAMSRNLDLDDGFYDLTSTNVSFDRIRNYIVDADTGVLKSAEPTTYDNTYQLYSQLMHIAPTVHNGETPETMQQKIREATNDTDFNRMQYYLMCVEKFLLFREGYVCENTAKLGNLALFHLCLLSESKPILNYSSNDLRGNILGYMIDMVVRSRLVQMWQRYPATSRLLNDMSRNYDSNNHLVRLCQMRASRDRAQYILNSLKSIKDGNANSLSDNLNYDMYFETLQKFKINVEGIDYYYLGSEFITKLGMSSVNAKRDSESATQQPHSGSLFEDLYKNSDKIEELLGRGGGPKK